MSSADPSRRRSQSRLHGTDRVRPGGKRRPVLLGVISALALAVAIAGCGGSEKSSEAKSVPASAKQTISFSLNGLGTEGEETKKQVKEFERTHPNIKVELEILSPNSTVYLEQLEHRFIAGSSSPDLLESDVTYPAKFAKAGWIKSLSSLNPELSRFFPNIVAAGTYKGTQYAIPWFSNPEGLFYRTDLIPTPPKSPEELVSEAKRAMSEHPELKEGLAFEGHKYEGAITSFLTVAPAFGGKLAVNTIAIEGNVKALTWLHEAIYVHKIAPAAVTGWEEGQVQEEFTSGHTPFAINYPFVAAVAEEGGPAKGHVGYIPFPPAPGGKPGAALGGEMLAINAKSSHADAAWALIQYLTSHEAQVNRALATGDPPAVPSAYNEALYAKAPIFKKVKALNEVAQSRPVSPEYLRISELLQEALSSVYANSASPASALASAAAQIKSLEG